MSNELRFDLRRALNHLRPDFKLDHSDLCTSLSLQLKLDLKPEPNLRQLETRELKLKLEKLNKQHRLRP